MSSDADNAGDAYQVRLKGLLGLYDNNELQTLFRGKSGEFPVQEEIWLDAQAFLKQNFDLNLDLPPRITHAGRFVQFPKSQSLLITEELRRFTTFFAQEFQVKEIIPFTYFRSRLNLSLTNINTTTRAKELLNDPLKAERCARQVFNFFNSWQGEIYENISKRNKNSKHRQTAAQLESATSLILTFNNDKPELYLIEKESRKPILLEWSTVFSIPKYKTFYSGIYFFTQLDTYCDDYEDSRFLYPSLTNYILVNKNVKRRECEYLEKISDNKIEISGPVALYKVSINCPDRGSPLAEYMLPECPATLFGGLKFGRGNIFIKGFGPAICCASPCAVLHENRKCEYDREISSTGKYKVRVDNYKDIEFEIIEFAYYNDVVLSRKGGWKLSNYSFHADFDIEGCGLKELPGPESIDVRDWIGVNLGIKYKGTNILLSAISNNRK